MPAPTKSQIIQKIKDLLQLPSLTPGQKEQLERHLQNLIPHQRAELAMTIANDDQASVDQRLRSADLLAQYYHQAEV